jgi:DNA-directed RNA polymerase specialized sigma24 family protein
LSTPQDPFDALLAWLDPDRDIAAQKYEIIRQGLIRIFVAKGFSRAEDMADEAFRRASERLPDPYVGERFNYFRGIARNLIKEAYRLKEIATDEIPEPPIVVIDHSDEYECLLRCLRFLPSAKRDLILDYHVYEGHDKIAQHEIMAEEIGISKGALRLRAFHLRADLEKCVLNCAQIHMMKTKPVPADIVNGGAETRSVNDDRGRTN